LSISYDSKLESGVSAKARAAADSVESASWTLHVCDCTLYASDRTHLDCTVAIICISVFFNLFWPGDIVGDTPIFIRGLTGIRDRLWHEKKLLLAVKLSQINCFALKMSLDSLSILSASVATFANRLISRSKLTSSCIRGHDQKSPSSGQTCVTEKPILCLRC
jgi:hypothetical protein